MPKFGLTMQEGTIQQWYKAEGDRVTAGDPLFEVETEKVLYDVEAPRDGVIARILYPAESTVAVASVVAVIATDGENPDDVRAKYPPSGQAAPPTGTASRPLRSQARPAAAMDVGRGATGRGPAVTPAARKLAKERGVGLDSVKGTGPGGRITREDVEAAFSSAPAGAPLRGMRKLIAERMLRSVQSTAQLTITTEADVTATVRRKRALQDEFSVTYTDLVVEAVAAALRQHPRLNATVDGETLCAHSAVHIGLAVALDDGLIVPVLRDAHRKPLRVIAEEAKLLAEKARAGALSVDDVSGGTFTITNLGAYGVDAFTPIIHLPQVAILGVGRVLEKPAVHDGKIAIRSLMTLSLTFDHRVVDGVPAAAFLQAVAQALGADG